MHTFLLFCFWTDTLKWVEFSCEIGACRCFQMGYLIYRNSLTPSGQVFTIVTNCWSASLLLFFFSSLFQKTLHLKLPGFSTHIYHHLAEVWKWSSKGLLSKYFGMVLATNRIFYSGCVQLEFNISLVFLLLPLMNVMKFWILPCFLVFENIYMHSLIRIVFLIKVACCFKLEHFRKQNKDKLATFRGTNYLYFKWILLTFFSKTNCYF